MKFKRVKKIDKVLQDLLTASTTMPGEVTDRDGEYCHNNACVKAYDLLKEVQKLVPYWRESFDLTKKACADELQARLNGERVKKL